MIIVFFLTGTVAWKGNAISENVKILIHFRPKCFITRDKYIISGEKLCGVADNFNGMT